MFICLFVVFFFFYNKVSKLVFVSLLYVKTKFAVFNECKSGTPMRCTH